MKHLRHIILGLLTIAVLGCEKEKIVTAPCGFDVSVDSVKGSKVTFTITPGNRNACYVFDVVTKGFASTYMVTDEEWVEDMIDWMESIYSEYTDDGNVAIGSFADMFCYRGARTLTRTNLQSNLDYQVVVLQINPATHEPIGPLYKTDFHTKSVETNYMTFHIEYLKDLIHIFPSDEKKTWFWEYELKQKIKDNYGDRYNFFYSIIDMYSKYGFLENLLNSGYAEWSFTNDDPSLRDGEIYTLAIAGCEDGELTSDVYYIDFYRSRGELHFDVQNSNIEVYGLGRN